MKDKSQHSLNLQTQNTFAAELFLHLIFSHINLFHMKKILISVPFVLLGIFFACKHTDQTLINNIQQEVALQNQSASEFNRLKRDILLVMMSLNQAPPEVMQNPLFQEVVKETSIIEAKAKVSDEEFSNNSAKLMSLAEAYTTGKISKEAAEKEYTALKTDSIAVKNLISTLDSMIDSTQAKWVMIMPK